MYRDIPQYLYIYIIYIIDLTMQHVYMRIPVGKWSIDL